MARNHAETPLTLALTTKGVRATPLDVFKPARKRWLRSERLNLNDIADEIGINRATLFRWVGTKELLLAEIIWSVYEPTLEQAKVHLITYMAQPASAAGKASAVAWPLPSETVESWL